MRKVIAKCDFEHAAQVFCRRRADSTYRVLEAFCRHKADCEAFWRYRADSTVVEKRFCGHRADGTVFSKRFVDTEPGVLCFCSVL